MLVPPPGEAEAEGRADPVPHQLLEGALRGRMLRFLTVPKSFSSNVSVLGNSLLTWHLSVLQVPLCCLGHWSSGWLGWLDARALTLVWKDPQSGTLSCSPAVNRTAQVLQLISIHFSAR